MSDDSHHDRRCNRDPRPLRPRLRRRAEILLAAVCALSVVFLAYRDLALPAVGDVEIWLGLELHGAWARWTAPLHWALFAIAAWAFARGRRWVWQAAPIYLGYVAVSHLVWNLTSPDGGGLDAALAQLGLFAAIGAALAALDRCLTRPATPPRDRGRDHRRPRSRPTRAASPTDRRSR